MPSYKDRTRKRNNFEEQHQIALVKWFGLSYPELRDNLTLGSFGENIGAKRMGRLKQMGLTPGYPDLFLAVPRLPMYAGLYIEMKEPDGRLRENQKRIHKVLRNSLYYVATCYDWLEAKQTIEAYLNYGSDIQYPP